MNLLVLILLSLNISLAEVTEEKIDYYVNLILEVGKNSSAYVWPTSADGHRSSGKPEKFGTFDFIVVGAGSGGTVAANRISQIKEWDVLLLEAGTRGNNWTEIPYMFGPVEFSEYNWAFNSTPQTTCCQGNVNKVCLYPRGKGLGGTSLINALMSVRGFRSDYDRWARLVGNKRWCYRKVLRYFKRIEYFVRRDPEAPVHHWYHGYSGPLRVEYHLPRSPQIDNFFQANKELGFNMADYNANRIGVSHIQLNMKDGTRFDGARAFLDPIRHRTNLKILTESYVTKIRIDKDSLIATGVEFSHKGRSYYAEARKEVILAAGVFGSAQILMLSGVGPRKHLEDLKIDVVADLEVGSTLLDHSAFFGLNYGTNYTAETKSLREHIKDYFNGVGLLTNTVAVQGIGMYESAYSAGTGVPDFELLMAPAPTISELMQKIFSLTDETYEDLWKYANPLQTFTVFVLNLHSQSVGTFRLKSNDPYDYPLITPNFISDPEDRDINVLYEGIQMVMKLAQTKAFRRMNATLQGGPLRACKQHEYLSRAYWFCALRQLTMNLYHPTSTCKMGTDPKDGAVVDSELRVFGFRNLRIADASVFPFSIACHPHTPIVMIAEQLGDLIMQTYRKELKYFFTL